MNDRMLRDMMQSMGMGMPLDMFEAPYANPPFQPMLGQMASLMPQQFMSPMSMMMMNPFAGMQQAMSMGANVSNPGFSYCSSSVTSYTTDEHGRPQVYQQSQEVKSGPGGVKETKSAVKDSRTGHQEMAIGHHLYDKAHIKKKSKNAYTGDEEQGEEFVNLEENEAERFEHDWTHKARNSSSYDHSPYHRVASSRHGDRLALTASAHDGHTLINPSPSHHAHHSHRHSSDKSSSKKDKEKKKRKKSPTDLSGLIS